MLWYQGNGVMAAGSTSAANVPSCQTAGALVYHTQLGTAFRILM